MHGLLLTLAGSLTASCGVAAENLVASFGKDLRGWKPGTGDWRSAATLGLNPTNAKSFNVTPGHGLIVNGPRGRTVNLVSERQFGDLEAHLEFVVPKDSNSGVYFMGRYEIQVFDSDGKSVVKSSDCGGLYASCSEPKPDWPGIPASVNASKAPGEWQSFDVIFRAPRFDASGRKTENAKFIKVVHNGRIIHENIEVPRPTCAALTLDEKPLGPLMLQGDHGPVAYRNVVLKPVSLP